MIPTPPVVIRKTIPAGRAGTMATVREMVRLIREGAVWPPTRPFALRIVKDVAARDFYGMALRLRQWAEGRMVFRNDPFGVETLQAVRYMLDSIRRNGLAYGDCDDFTILIGALGKALGFPVKVRVIRYGENRAFGHVVPVLLVRGFGWMELDATVRAGEPPMIARSETADSEVIR